MIAFDLACDCGFQFEGWFEDREDFVRQQENRQVLCPQCGCASVRKILSPVAYQKRSFSGDTGISADKLAASVHAGDLLNTAQEVLKNVQEIVEKNFEDVGVKFAQKALKMHYGVEEPKNIRGVVSSDEEKLLKSEGIALLKVPMLKQEDDKKH